MKTIESKGAKQVNVMNRSEKKEYCTVTFAMKSYRTKMPAIIVFRGTKRRLTLRMYSEGTENSANIRVLYPLNQNRHLLKISRRREACEAISAKLPMTSSATF